MIEFNGVFLFAHFSFSSTPLRSASILISIRPSDSPNRLRERLRCGAPFGSLLRGAVSKRHAADKVTSAAH
jgi:hypothetical protein